MKKNWHVEPWGKFKKVQRNEKLFKKLKLRFKHRNNKTI